MPGPVRGAEPGHFQSEMILVPDTGLGLFVSASSPGGIDAVTDLNKAFFDRFLPGT